MFGKKCQPIRILISFFIEECNSLDSEKVRNAFGKSKIKNVQFVLMHPLHLDIVKFTDNPDDLLQIGNLKEFIGKLRMVCENSLKYLDKKDAFVNQDQIKN